MKPQPVLRGSPEKALGQESVLCSRLPQQRGVGGGSSLHGSESEDISQACREIEMDPKFSQRMQIPKVPASPTEFCPPRDRQTAVLSGKGQGCVLSRALNCLNAPLQQVKPLASQGDFSAREACEGPTPERPPVATHPLAGIHARPGGDEVLRPHGSAAGLPSSRLEQRHSLDQSRCDIRMNLASARPEGPSETVAEGRSWAINKTGKALAVMKSSVMVVGDSNEPTGSPRGEVSKVQHHCRSSAVASNKPLPPVEHRRNHMGDARAAPSNSNSRGEPTWLVTGSRGSQTPVGPVTTAPAARGRLPTNASAAQRLPSTVGSRITRSQTAAAALTEVVRIEDSSDEEEGPVTTHKHGVHGSVAQGQPTSEAADGRSAFNSSPGPPRGVGRAETEAASAFLILMAALVRGDGHCCVLSAEALSRVAAECAMLQPHQHHRSRSEGAPDSTVGGNGVLEPRFEEDSCRADGVLVLQANPEEGDVSLYLWQPPPEPALATPEAGEKLHAEAFLDRQAELQSPSSLVSLLCFPKSMISRLRWLGLGGSGAFPDILKSDLSKERGRAGDWTHCSKAMSCCRCRGNSAHRSNPHAKNKKDMRARAMQAQAKPGLEPTVVDTHSRSDGLDSQTIGGNSSSNSGDTSVQPISSALALSGGAAVAPCSASADVTHPISVLAREDMPTAEHNAAAAGEYERPKTAQKARSSTHRGASDSPSEEPEHKGEALRKHCSSSYHRRQSRNRSTNKPSSSSQSKPSQKRRRERKEKPSKVEGSLGRGRTASGDCTPTQCSGALLLEEEQAHGIVTPRNALIVTDGKPLHGIPLPTTDVGLPVSCSSTRCEVKRDETAKKSKRDSSNNRYGISDSAEDQDVERQQHLVEGPSKFESRLTLSSSVSREQQLQEIKERREHRPVKELPHKDASVRKSTVYYGHTCSKCLKASGRHASSQEGRAVPVLFLELQQSQASKLNCSDLLQKMFEQERKSSICCLASSLQEGQPNTGKSSGAACKTSAAFSDSPRPIVHTKSSRHRSSHRKRGRSSKSGRSRGGSDSSSSASISSTNSNSSGASSSIKNSMSTKSNSNVVHGHSDASRESPTEGGHGLASVLQSSSTSNRSSRTRSSTSKHERSSNSRRPCRSSSSKRKKLRREASSTSPVAAAGYRKELRHSPAQNLVAQRSDDIAGSIPTHCTGGVPANVISSIANLTEIGPCERSHFREGTSPAAALPTRALDFSIAREKPSVAIEAIDEFSPRIPMGSSKKKGPWLLLCVGPALHVAPSTEKTTGGGKQSDSKTSEADPAVPNLGCASPGDEESNGGGAKLQFWEKEIPTGCRSDLLSLFEVLLPSTLVDGAPLDRFRGRGTLYEHTDVADLVAFFTGCITEHKWASLENQGNRGQQLPQVISHVSRVLHDFLMSSLGPWKALRKGRRAVSSFSVERLVSCWRARGLQAAVDSSIVGASGDVRISPFDAAASHSSSALPKADIKVESSATLARPTAVASPPVFDLLLDDRTLRRLSEKEFLDDTIIDFCLGFIVDHILTPEERLRVHISNTFFLSALMEQRCEMEAHTRLTRWLKKEVTPLPKKDFIFIPVHHKHQHWSLAVVVYPWRALNPSQTNAENGTVGKPEKSVCKHEISKPVGDVQELYPLDVPAHQAGIKGSPRSSSVGKVTPFLIGKCRGVDVGHEPASLKASGPHSQKPPREKARLFHVDSMGLRSVFDRCRGRLKRFLRQEFEHRCGGELKSGERVELCTDSCCWHDGHSCTLHTPRQQNGYDCGVFVVEYVYFLTRNLNAIETLLVGPSRDCQSQPRYPEQPSAGSIRSSTFGCLGRVDTPVEGRSQGKLLQAALGFHCPCMETGFPAQMPTGAGSAFGSAFGLHSSLKARLSELRQAHAALFGSSSTMISRQRELPLQAGAPPAPLSVSHGEDSTRELTPQRVDKIRCPVKPREVSGLHGRPDSTEVIRLPDSHLSDGRAASKQQCPLWGPLPLCISKRRSSHTKWFSQDRAVEIAQDAAVHATEYSLEGGPKAYRPSEVVILEYWQLMTSGFPEGNR
ncbi:ulp1 protease family, C-terminal catalytic domain-containing protein, putative [Eimeria praecox]|uniref:Ulp1 protease family, C-terminal catalytic domain-containing protein, putative n=1 Tax=Eimeria praecox TaxID=51316 RepID=U6G6X4_9EIME|nr:ulp1 protease family, C-terminal catalytic domain-containing protein, putative [Eimeria praecox]